MLKRDELITEYCRQVNEEIGFLREYMENVVPAGRPDEEIYWKTKRICQQLRESSRPDEAEELIYSYLRDAERLYLSGEPWKTRITDRRRCRNTILNHLQMLCNVSYWLREQGEPLAEEVCSWLLTEESEEVQHVRSGQTLEAAATIYPALQKKRA